MGGHRGPGDLRDLAAGQAACLLGLNSGDTYRSTWQLINIRNPGVASTSIAAGAARRRGDRRPSPTLRPGTGPEPTSRRRSDRQGHQGPDRPAPRNRSVGAADSGTGRAPAEESLDPRTVKPGLLDQLGRRRERPPTSRPPRQPTPTLRGSHDLRHAQRACCAFCASSSRRCSSCSSTPTRSRRRCTPRCASTARRAREAEREHAGGMERAALHRAAAAGHRVSRVSLEMQSLSLRVESLATRADFAERRIRGLEGRRRHRRCRPTFDTPAAPSGPARQPSDASTSSTGTGTGTGHRRASEGRRHAVAAGVAAAATSPAAGRWRRRADGPTSGDLADGDDEAFEDGPGRRPEADVMPSICRHRCQRRPGEPGPAAKPAPALYPRRHRQAASFAADRVRTRARKAPSFRTGGRPGTGRPAHRLPNRPTGEARRRRAALRRRHRRRIRAARAVASPNTSRPMPTCAS